MAYSLSALLTFYCFFLMIRRTPRSTRTDTLFPDTPLVRSDEVAEVGIDEGDGGEDDQRPAERQAHEHHRRYKQRQKYDLVRFSGDGAAHDDVVEAVPEVGPRHQGDGGQQVRSEEHTSELQSLMRISYAVFCLKKKQQLT